MRPPVLLRQANIFLEVKGQQWQLVWARQVEGEFFEVSLCDNDNCYNAWLARIKDGKVELLSEANYVTPEEWKTVEVLQKLGVERSIFMERVFKERIKAYG